MVADVQIVLTGWDELAASLRRVGSGVIRRRSTEAIKRAVHGTDRRVRESLAAGLPHRGGLAALVAGGTHLRTTVRGERVRVTADGPANLAGIDAGRVTHPLFGNRGHWFAQRVPSGLVREPITSDVDNYRSTVADAVRQVLRRI